MVNRGHRINTQPEVRLRVGAFDVGVLVFSAAAIFLANVHGKCLRYTEDVDVVFTKNSSLFTLERGRCIRMLCGSSNFHKQKLVKPKPLASKMVAVKKVGQKNGETRWDKKTEVGLLCRRLHSKHHASFSTGRSPAAVSRDAKGFICLQNIFLKKITVKYNIYNEIVLLPFGGGIFCYHCTRKTWTEDFG